MFSQYTQGANNFEDRYGTGSMSRDLFSAQGPNSSSNIKQTKFTIQDLIHVLQSAENEKLIAERAFQAVEKQRP